MLGTSPGPTTIDPSQALTADDWYLVSAVHESLYRLNEQNQPIINLLARSPQPIKNGREWRCTLRKDILFHTGERVHSHDVIASVRRLNGTRFGWIPQQFRLKKLNNTTFTIRSRRTIKRDDLERILASPALSILPKKWDGKSGLGPFKLQRWSPTETLSLSRNDEHHRGTPYLESLVIRRYAHKHGVRDAFRIGALDVVFLDSLHALDQLPDSAFQKGIRVKGQHTESVGLIVPESRSHISRNERIQVRTAITRTTVQHEVVGKTRVAKRWMPRVVAPSPKIPLSTSNMHNIRSWQLACPQSMKAACQAIAAATPNVLDPSGNNGQPWSYTLMTPTQERAARQLPATAPWDALLVSIIHIDPWKRGALSTISTILKGKPTMYGSRKMWKSGVWLPLFERRAFMVHKPQIYNLRFSFTSLSDLGEVWRQ